MTDFGRDLRALLQFAARGDAPPDLLQRISVEFTDVLRRSERDERVRSAWARMSEHTPGERASAICERFRIARSTLYKILSDARETTSR